MCRIITPTLKVANNGDSRAHVFEIAAQRITGHVEEGFTSYDMMRGHEEEVDARDHYRKHYAPVEDVRLHHQRPLGLHARLLAGRPGGRHRPDRGEVPQGRASRSRPS
jgi:hypothetical protein